MDDWRDDPYWCAMRDAMVNAISAGLEASGHKPMSVRDRIDQLSDPQYFKR